MNTIEINGKKYEKASVMAEKNGYTADYIGQLCRAEKVDATLVGRTWYIEPSSLKKHKSGRYRSSSKKTAVALKATVAEHRSTAAAQQVHVSVHSYEEDSTELLPSLMKHRLHVEQKSAPNTARKEDTIAVRVVSRTPATVLKPSELPEVNFGGTLNVIPLDDIEEEVLPVKKTPNKPRKVVPLQRVEESEASTVPISKLTLVRSQQKKSGGQLQSLFITVSFTTVLCFLVFLSASSLEGTVEVANAGQSVGWSLSTNFLLDALANGLK